MSVYILDRNSGSKVWWCPAYPIFNLESTYKGPQLDKFDRLKLSIKENGILNPVVGTTTNKDICITTGKQRIEACIQEGVTHVPILVWDTGRILPDQLGYWGEIRSQEEGDRLFGKGYNFSMSFRGFTKDLEEEWK